MENLKIIVNNEAESKEAQELFFELGYKFSMTDFCLETNSVQVFDNGSGSTFSDHDTCAHKEITLPELRDMVVLKRNDPKDANVSEENCLYDLYLTESEDLYFYHCGKNEWILSNLNGDEDYYKSLKPIENPMKEYLRKEKDSSYSMVEGLRKGHPNWIDVPSGAEVAAVSDCCDVYFWRNNGNLKFDKHNKKWSNQGNLKTDIEKRGYKIVWQRFVEKEYINKTTGEYRKTAEKVTGEQWLEVPDGADALIELRYVGGAFRFIKFGEVISVWRGYRYWEQTEYKDVVGCFGHVRMVWQRPTQPEPLPFIDDEPKRKTISITIDPNTPRSAIEINEAAMQHIVERGKTYDSRSGERSAKKTAQAFNAITGKSLSESDVWLLLSLLKMVRQESKADYHKDSAEDLIAYASLYAESLESIA